MATTNQEKKMYDVYCTECGSLIRGKYFPLDNLLNLYFNGETQEEERNNVIDMLGIGVIYGGPVLPVVPPLLEKNPDGGKYIFNRPSLDSLKNTKSRLNCFTCGDGEIPMNALVSVDLNIASVVAQFCMSSGSELLYDMLQRYYDLDWNDEDRSGDMALNAWCEQFAQLQKERMSAMGQTGLNAEQVRQNLQTIIEFAKTEAERVDTRHFALESRIWVGWWYQVINGRKMPYRLAVVGSTGEAFHCTDCCCDRCHTPLPYELGAYRQKIVGLLGTQSTGKTTYQTALADAIDRGEATSLITGNGVTRHTQISIQPNMVNDPQWTRAKREPVAPKNQMNSFMMGTAVSGKKDEKSGAGPLWLYQNGYPVEKTPDEKLEAGALTFLISREDGAVEPVMYTLADIPGEAFSEVFQRHKDALHVERQYALLKRCDALLMVISSRQLQNRQDSTADENVDISGMVRSPGEILECYKKFLPERAVPTVVVMTAADEINGGNLRRPMQLAFDLRNASALVWSERRQELVYNAEQMRTVSDAVRGYIDRKHGGFIHDLYNVLKDKGGKVKLAAFAVSSGTQYATVDYKNAKDELYRSKAQCEARYNQVVAARFGVVAPLLWLLACDDLMPMGRPDTPYNDYPEDVRKKIGKYLKTIL